MAPFAFMSRHLLVAVSSHGFGHFSQVAPVLNALLHKRPDIRLTLRTELPRQLLEQRLGHPFAQQIASDDFGMLMHNAVDVDTVASLAAYRDFHANWDEHVTRVADEMAQDRPDLLLGDVPYLTLAAAARLGVKSIALCSLNWADVLAVYADETIRAEVLPAICAAYAGVERFICVAPVMPMPLLQQAGVRLVEVGPVCAPGRDSRVALRQCLGVDEATSLVLVGMGGMPFALNTAGWPIQVSGRRVHYLLPSGWCCDGLAATALDQVPFAYADVLASVDLVITKPGYGMFVEAAAAGVPVLYVERQVWPEVTALEQWLSQVGHCRRISRRDLEQGALAPHLEILLQLGRYQPVNPGGVAAAAELLAGLV